MNPHTAVRRSELLRASRGNEYGELRSIRSCGIPIEELNGHQKTKRNETGRWPDQHDCILAKVIQVPTKLCIQMLKVPLTFYS